MATRLLSNWSKCMLLCVKNAILITDLLNKVLKNISDRKANTSLVLLQQILVFLFQPFHLARPNTAMYF